MSSILCMQLLHWICVYCGCASNLNCETSQSDIYLTAKTAGEAEEDTGAPRPVPAFVFLFFFFVLLWECESGTSGTANGTFGSNPDMALVAFLSRRSPGHGGLLLTPLPERWGGGASGVPHTFKGILVVNILSRLLICHAWHWKPLKTSYTVGWFHLTNCASPNVLTNLWVLFKLFSLFSFFFSCFEEWAGEGWGWKFY